MHKRILLVVTVLVMAAMLLMPASVMAAGSGTVGVTAGESTVSMTISPTAWNLGTITDGTPVTSWVSGTEGYFTLTNDGTVSESFTISGSNASGSTVTWTLSTSPSAADEYSLGFGQATDPYTSEPSYTYFDTSGETLVSNLQVGTYLFDLEFNTYTGTDVSQMMSASITITAVAS